MRLNARLLSSTAYKFVSLSVRAVPRQLPRRVSPSMPLRGLYEIDFYGSFNLLSTRAPTGVCFA